MALGSPLVAAVLGYSLDGRERANTQTSTIAAYRIEIRPLSLSMDATAGSTISLLFDVASPRKGAPCFYASEIPAPGSQTTLDLRNVTTGNIRLPTGVDVSYPAGQAVFGASHAMLVLQVAFSPAVSGTVGLVVGVFQQASEDQVVGTGYYINVLRA